jgi:hypothetical protein
MSNVKRSYNTSRRIRKGFKERVNHFDLMRPLRIIAKAMTDEYKIESLFLDQEINILFDYRTLNRHRFVGREY